MTEVAQRAAERAEHRPVVHRLRRRDRRVRVAHRRGGDHAALEDQRRLHAEERRLPQHEVGAACPTSIEPTACAMPCVIAGLIVYLAT